MGDEDRETDVILRYRDRQQLLDGGGFGVEVTLAGDRLADFGPWIDEGAPQRAAQRSMQGSQLAIFGSFGFTYGLLALLAFPFLKRYHEGEIGVSGTRAAASSGCGTECWRTSPPGPAAPSARTT